MNLPRRKPTRKPYEKPRLKRVPRAAAEAMANGFEMATPAVGQQGSGALPGAAFNTGP
ncbi:MAG: hypothetical protein KDK91_03550 [Gammaproteobacteria bacterium]|nr:hypothetical protein [Gammaproteobacteria bacterium]